MMLPKENFKIIKPYYEQLMIILERQKYRIQDNIVIVTDDREDFDASLTDFDNRVMVLSIPDMRLGNVFHSIKQHSKFGKGTIFVFSGGTFDLLNFNILPDCRRCDCRLPQQILTIPAFNNNHAYLINKALKLNMDLLDSTLDDVAIFCGLMPIPFEQYYNYIFDKRQCLSQHSAKIVPYGDKNNFTNYRIALKWYNDFTKCHAKSLFYEPWVLEQSYFCKPLATIFEPNYYKISPAESTKRCKLIKSLCTKLLTTRPISFSSQLKSSEFGPEYSQQHEEGSQSTCLLSKRHFSNLNSLEDNMSSCYRRSMSPSYSNYRRVETVDRSPNTQHNPRDHYFRFHHRSSVQSSRPQYSCPSYGSSRSPFSRHSDRSFADNSLLSNIRSNDLSFGSTNISDIDHTFRDRNSQHDPSPVSHQISQSDNSYSSRHISPINRPSRSHYRYKSTVDQSSRSCSRSRSPVDQSSRSHSRYGSRVDLFSSFKYGIPVDRSSRFQLVNPVDQSYSSQHICPVAQTSRYLHTRSNDQPYKSRHISSSDGRYSSLKDLSSSDHSSNLSFRCGNISLIDQISMSQPESSQDLFSISQQYSSIEHRSINPPLMNSASNRTSRSQHISLSERPTKTQHLSSNDSSFSSHYTCSSYQYSISQDFCQSDQYSKERKAENKETQSGNCLSRFNSSFCTEPVYDSLEKNAVKDSVDSQCELRTRLGDHLFEEYSVKLEVARSSFDKKFELYRHLPQMYTHYKQYYDTFSATYDAQYGHGNGNQEHKNGCWNRFWQSNFKVIKSEEWQKEHKFFLVNYCEKATFRYPTSSTNSLSSFNSTFTRPISSIQGSVMGTKSMPVLSEEALCLIESVCDKLSYLGPTLKDMITKCRALGVTNKEAYGVFTNPDNAKILKLALTKLKAAHQSSTGDARILYGKVTDMIMFYSKSNIAAINPLTHNNDENKPLVSLIDIDKNKKEHSFDKNKLSLDFKKLPVDINAIADATMGKGDAVTLDFVKTSLAYKGILNPPQEVIHDIFLKVCSLHFTNSFKTIS